MKIPYIPVLERWLLAAPANDTGKTKRTPPPARESLRAMRPFCVLQGGATMSTKV